MKHKLVCIMLSICLCSSASPVLAEENSADNWGASFANAFQNIDSTNVGGMLRWWLPGDNLDQEELAREVHAIAEAGFTGVEVVRHKVYDGGNGDGWMSDAWVESCITIMKAAKEAGIQVDFMMTGGNLSIPVEDPSATDATDRHLVNKETEITIEPGYDGSPVSVKLEAPEATDTVYVGKMISVSAAKVEEINDEQAVRMDIDSVIHVYSAFDNDDERFSKEEENLDTYTEEDLTVDVSFPANDTNEAITYLVSAIWQVPTGGTFGTMYYIDHLNKEGAQAILNYYDEAIAKYPEFAELLNEVGGSLFGDSLEFTNSGEWSNDMLQTFYDRYRYDCAPYLVCLFNEAKRGFGGPGASDEPTPTYDFGDEKGETFRNAYYSVITDLYMQNNVNVFQEWAQQYGMNYRGQSTYNYYAYNSEASLDLAITETESLHFQDYPTSYRAQSGSAHVGNGTGIYSSEVGEIMNRAFMQTWQEELWHMNRLFVGGVNQIIHHGFAYATNAEDDSETWPGYLGMFSCGNDLKTFFPSFEYLNDYNDYTARTSYLLQQGEADMDLAVFNYDWNLEGGYSDIYADNGLLDSLGYNYDFVQPAFFELENATVENGELFPEEASYKALIFNNQKTMPLDTLKKVIEYADAGLPMVFIGSLPSMIGEYTGNVESNDAVQAEFDQLAAALTEKDNVVVVADYAGVPDALNSMGITPDASYEENAIMTYHRVDEGVDYYFVSNQKAVYEDTKWQNETGTEADITLQGSGKPYELDLWTGKITPIADYTENEDGSITIHVVLAANDSKAYAVAMDEWYTGDVKDTHVTSGNGSYVYSEDGSIILRATEAGTYTTELSDGNVVETSVDDVNGTENLTSWHLQFTNYEPAEDADTYWNVNKTVVYDEDIEGVQSFNTLENLEGCETMSGIGTYTATINWDSSKADGAYLDLGKVKDLYRLFINDSEVVGANPLDPAFDIGEYLIDGENTIRVEVASNLYNAVVGERGYEAPLPSGFGGGTLEQLPDELTDTEFGLLSEVTLTPYKDIQIS